MLFFSVGILLETQLPVVVRETAGSC
jgi:hypothetical protein